MNWNNVLEVGLKLVVAAGAGFAIFMGIENATKRNQQNINVANQPNPETGGTTLEPVNNKCTGNENVVVSGLRAAQNTCGKLFNLTQGLVTVVESVGSFANNNYNYNCPDYGGYGYYPPQQPYYNGGSVGWRRVNPFIIEQVPQQGQQINYNTQYPY